MNPQHHSLNPTVKTTSSNSSEKDAEFAAVAWDGFQPEQPDPIGGMGPQLHPVLSLSTSLLRCWGFKEYEDEGSHGLLCFSLASPQGIYCSGAFRGEVKCQIAAITGCFTVLSVLCFENTSLRLDVCQDRCECRLNLCLIPL